MTEQNKLKYSKWFACAMLVGLFVIAATSFCWGAIKIAIVTADTTAPAEDSLLYNFVRDSIKSPSTTAVTAEWIDDLQANNFSQTQWDSANIDCIIWTSLAFGYDINTIDIPIFTFKRTQVSAFGLGTGTVTQTADKVLLSSKNHWITDPYPGDTLFAIAGANISWRDAIGVNGGDLKSLTTTTNSSGADTANYVVVDSGALLQDGIATAPNRRVYFGMENPNRLTWAHGWDMLFTRGLYYLINDTTNPIVRNRVKVGDHFLANTWFEIGSCNMATISDNSDIRVGFDQDTVSALLRYDSLVAYIGAAPTDSSITIDSVDWDMYINSNSPYNIQGGDSTFDFRARMVRVRRQVKFEQGSSTYDGSTCSTSDTASTTNNWNNRFTPSYPSTSRHLWASSYGDLVTDSAWKAEGARDTTVDIFPWRLEDTVHINMTLVPPDSWTDFPMNPSWFQAWLDTPATNYGFGMQLDVVYDTSNVEMNYIGPTVLPTSSDDLPRLTIYWSYTANAVPAVTATKRAMGYRR